MTATYPLGRREPKDWEHVEKYPLRELPTAIPLPGGPVIWGVNWYTNFDTPVRFSNRWWVGRGSLGMIRGGHAICSPSLRQKDVPTWWKFYDQGVEGACVGFAASRMMSLLNRKRYAAFWLYHEAQKIDEWEGTDYQGTSVRAALDVLRTRGHCRIRNGETDMEALGDGIRENRWATTITEVLDALHSARYQKMGAIPFLNSWGVRYPRIVWMELAIWERLLNEGGECGLIIDR